MSVYLGNSLLAGTPDITSKANTSLNNLDSTGQAVINGKVDLDLNNMSPSATAKETIVGWGMPDYTRGVTFNANTAIQAPYDCVVFWNAGSSINNPRYFMISQTGAFTGEHLTFPFYVNNDGYTDMRFYIPKGWYFKTSANFEAATFSPSQYFPLKGV